MNARSLPRIGLYGLGLAILLGPALCYFVPPFVDLPNHLARFHILLNYQPDFGAVYDVHYNFVPNVLFDWLIVKTALILDLSALEIGYALSVLMIVLPVISVAVLHYALHRRLSLWPLFALLFSYNGVLLYGFVNYYLAVCLALICFAVWIFARDRSLAIRMALFAPLQVVLFLGHLYGWGVFGLLVIGYELSRQLRSGGGLRPAIWAPAVLPAVLLFLLFISSSPTASELRVAYDFNWNHKLRAVIDILNVGDMAVNRISFLALALILGAGIYLRRLTIDRDMVPALVALVVVFLALPFAVFGSVLADYRLPVFIAFFGVAASDWRPSADRRAPAAGQMPERILGAIFVALLVLRSVSVAQSWSQAQSFFADLRDDIAVIESEAVVATLGIAEEVTGNPRRDWERFNNPPLDHLAAFAVIERGAIDTQLFADPLNQPISFKPAYWSARYFGIHDRFLRAADFAESSLWARICAYDYLFLLTGDAPRYVDTELMVPVVQRTKYALVRISRSRDVCGAD